MRKALRQFAEHQEAILKDNDYEDGWENCSSMWLWDKALEEMLELHDALKGDGDIHKECCDVANFVMMISDNEPV